MRAALGTLLCALAGGAPAAGAQAAPGPWLAWDPAANTATFALVAGAPGRSGPFNFNGYTTGAATLVVPARSSVVMNFRNDDYTPHSAVIIGEQGPLPNMDGQAAIPRAYTKALTQGMPQGGTDRMRFTAPAVGTFRIICGVPGHAASGMWIYLKVDSSATAASWLAP